MDSNPTKRLEDLAAFDPVTAGLLRPPACQETATVPDTDEICPEIAQWLTETHSPENPEVVMLLGGAQAREISALLERLPKNSQIFLMERELAHARRLFERLPLEKHMREQKLFLALGEDYDWIENQFFQMLNPHQAASFRIFDTGRSGRDGAAFYTAILQRIHKETRLDVFNAGTLVCRGPLWQFNTLKNLPHLIVNPGVNSLYGLFTGKPAIVVGAGPSLNEILPTLKTMAGRFVLVSTATALKPLRQNGIKPDLVLAVDGSHLTEPQFQTKCDDLYLVCSSLVFPPAIRSFKGIFSGRLDASPIDEWLESLTPPRGMLFAGGTVAASAIDVAREMGCDPIITVGLDLSFADDGTTHAQNTMYDGHRLAPETLIKTRGNRQPEVLTTTQFLCYIQLLEKYIVKHPDTTFINATDRGARIEGMRLAGPGDLAALAAKPFNAVRRIEKLHDELRPANIAGVRAKLEKIQEQLQFVLEDSRAAAMLCNQLMLILKSPQTADLQRAKTRLDELQAIEQRLSEKRDCSVFLKMSMWPASYKSGTKRADYEQGYSESMLTYRRARELYEQIAGSAKWTRDLMRKVIAELDAIAPQQTPTATEEEDFVVSEPAPALAIV